MNRQIKQNDMLQKIDDESALLVYWLDISKSEGMRDEALRHAIPEALSLRNRIKQYRREILKNRS